ncbi:MAG TPA: site-specific integrase, partial [Nonomuraea sp.]|nr:site-specific integrase [Nonomuraea sp.]
MTDAIARTEPGAGHLEMPTPEQPAGMAFFDRPATERRPALSAWVAALPALGEVDLDDRYGVHRLTALWLDFHAGNSAHTAAGYALDLRRWLAWCHEHRLDALRVRRADVDLYQTDLAADYEPRSVARRLASLSSWYEYLISNDVDVRNPVPRKGRPKTQAQSTTTVALSAAQAHAFLQQAAVDTGGRVAPAHAEQVRRRTAAALAVFLSTGARVSEVTGANIGDLGHTEGYDVLWVRRKGGKRQPLRLEPPVKRLLDTYLDERGTRDPSLPLFVT